MKTRQASLFADTGSVRTQVISSRKDFDALFDGYTKIRAISYVVSPDLLLEFFDKRGYTDLEVVVGENLSKSYRENLEQKGVEVTEQLAERVVNGTLRVLVPSRTIHSKLYILEDAGSFRVIQTSANLTETAQDARRQINYAWYADPPADNPFLQKVIQDYEVHVKGCSLFMEDLKNLFKERPDMDRQQVIEMWLKGGSVAEEDAQTKSIFEEISFNLLQQSNLGDEPLISLQLPDAPATRKRAESLLAPLNPTKTLNQLHVNGSAYIRYVNEHHRIPFMRVNLEQRRLLFSIDGSLERLTEPLPDSKVLNKALAHIEDYLQTVDSGQTTNPQSVKASMFEALLYVFSAPFSNEYMAMRRRRYAPVDNRGPRYLYIYGPSSNGKSTFLRFALKLMTGRAIEPLARPDFTMTRIRNAARVGTAFPLMFDDVDPSRTPGLEEVFKSYWERWWNEEYVSPQIIVSSNTSRLKDWAKSRVKRVDFDVHFAPTEHDKEKLALLFSTENPIFRWFSHLYLGHLVENELPSDDELHVARTVMKELYNCAQRPLPDFFPEEPIEKTYDPGRRDWRDLIYNLHRATVSQEGDRTLITFSQGFQPWEINDYQGYLPQTIKYQRRANMLIIENPNVFHKWLGSDPHTRSLLDRILLRKKP